MVSLMIARLSICLTRSRVKPHKSPTSSNVKGCPTRRTQFFISLATVESLFPFFWLWKRLWRQPHFWHGALYRTSRDGSRQGVSMSPPTPYHPRLRIGFYTIGEICQEVFSLEENFAVGFQFLSFRNSTFASINLYRSNQASLSSFRRISFLFSRASSIVLS